MKPFRLYEPTTINETVSTLRDLGDGAKLYAGGTELLLAMKSGLLQYDGLINVKRVPELDGLAVVDNVLSVGARATHSTVEHADEVLSDFPLIARVEHGIANVRVRNMGTIAGNLCFAEPHSDPGAVLLLYEAEVDIVGPDATRSVGIEELVVGPYETSLAPDELLTQVRVQGFPEGMRGAYLKFGYHHRPTLGIGAAVRVEDGVFADVRLTLGSVSPMPMRLRASEDVLRGERLDSATATARAGELAVDVCDAIDDLHGTAEYKRHLVSVFIERALTEAVERGER